MRGLKKIQLHYNIIVRLWAAWLRSDCASFFYISFILFSQIWPDSHSQTTWDHFESTESAFNYVYGIIHQPTAKIDSHPLDPLFDLLHVGVNWDVPRDESHVLGRSFSFDFFFSFAFKTSPTRPFHSFCTSKYGKFFCVGLCICTRSSTPCVISA